VSESTKSHNAPDRRDLLKGGAGALAAIAGFGMVSIVRAHEGTPAAAGSRDLNGYFGVTRRYVVAPDADVEELIAKVEGFVEIISATPGFAAYTILYNETTRVWIAVSLFDNAESAQASTEAAADYVAENDLGSYFVDPQPTVEDGQVIVNAGY
jgi:hypothetical protein